MTKSTSGKSLDEFREKHDPTFELNNPTAIYERQIPKGVKRYIVTAAQNATPVHTGWWAILRTMAQHFDAQILVIPLRYKNPTSAWSGSQSNAEYWPAEVRDYLWNVRRQLNENITVLADMKIQPTASSPLTGADGLSLASSGIIGHTKIQLKSIATPQSRMAKVLMTTGACTVENYTDSRAGKIGAFHHSLACVLVELDGSKRFFARHVHYDDKTQSATDLHQRFTADGVQPAPRPLVLNMGDTHCDFICPQVEKATFGSGGIIELTRPLALVWHDLNDDYSCNPHHLGNPFNPIAKYRSGRGLVAGEVFRAIDYAADRTKDDMISYIVPSNHNDFLGRWINRHDWRSDPENAEFYLETALAMVRETRMVAKGTSYPDPFTFWLRKRLADRKDVIALDTDQSLMLGSVENGMHGHQGPNGARGSITNLRRLGVKSNIGHGHSPGIDEGCYQNGTSTRLRLEYNHGASSWLNAHILQHADSKRQLLIMVDGRYRLAA